MKKEIIPLLFIFIFFVSSKVYALEVEYKGRNIGLKTDETSLFEDVKKAYPGDSIEDTIVIKNNSNEDKEIFFKIEGVNDTNNSVLKQLNLKIILTYDGENKEIYNGEYSLDKLKEYISIGTYKGNTNGSIKVTISLPTSINNDSSLAEIGTKWMFYTEGNAATDVDVLNPVTKDNINVYIESLIVSLILMSLILLLCKRNNKESDN